MNSARWRHVPEGAAEEDEGEGGATCGLGLTSRGEKPAQARDFDYARCEAEGWQ